MTTPNTITESVLDDKFRDSYAQIARERRWSIIGGNLEAIAMLALIGLVVVLVRYGFWGAGYSEFSAVQHNASVAMLAKLPGRHLGLMEKDLADKGYISLMDYKRYLQIAQEEKTRRGSAISDQLVSPEASGGPAEAEQATPEGLNGQASPEAGGTAIRENPQIMKSN